MQPTQQESEVLSFDIRPFQPADLADLQQLYVASRRAAFPWVDPREFRATDFSLDTRGEIIWIAERAGEPLGFASAWEPENFIHNLFVAPEHFLQGIGSALLDTCTKHLGRPASLKCVKRNQRALHFYLHLGWEIKGEGQGFQGEYFLMVLD